ncbi:MAG TPA: SWIM zinc finger family protein [Hanamia sp.]
MLLTEEQILALAPDESSKKSGKELANPAKWVSKGANETALWGECQGSGSKPYQAQIDLSNIAFKCSCPSRKFPCKHGLGLFLLYARQPKTFTSAEPPGWVKEWLDKRSAKEETKIEKKDKPVDAAAQAKRQQAREQKVSDGMEELLLWIKDIIRNGILNIPEKKDEFWGNLAKRMIDAQAPGLAVMVGELRNINFYKEGWQTKFIDRLIKIYLLVHAYKNIISLDENLQADIKSMIGFTQSQDELKTKDGIKDDWFVLAKQVAQEDQLAVERNWLYGINTKQYALVLQFYAGNQLPAITLTPGVLIHAELVFFPAAVPLRALIKEEFNIKAISNIEGMKNWNEVVEQEVKYNQLNPLINNYPFIVEQLKPVQFNNEWWLQDKEKNLMKISEDFPNIWKLVSISGGDSLSLAVVGKENNYLPLGVWQNGVYKLL